MAKLIRKPGPAKARVDAIIKAAGQDKHVKVGFLPSAKYENGMPAAYVAMIEENGVPEKNIPPRPAFGPTVERERENWREIMRQGAKAVLAGKATPEQVLEALGLRAAADVAVTISEVQSPPLQPKTIAARLRKKKDGKKVGSLDKPLVESGFYLSKVDSQVADGKGD